MNKQTKRAILVLIDIAVVLVAWVLSFLLVKKPVGEIFIKHYYFLIGNVAVFLISSWLFGLYKSMWRYAGVGETIRVIVVVLIVTVANCFIAGLSNRTLALSWAFVVSFLFAIGTVASRFSWVILRHISFSKKIHTHKKSPRVIIIGGGEGGSLLIKEIMSSDKIDLVPVCVLDDDKNKVGQTINGVPVVGTHKDVVKYAKKYNADEIIIAMPSVSEKLIKEIIVDCKKTSCVVKRLPGIYQFKSAELKTSTLREVNIDDLLGREQISVNLDEIMGYIENKVVLVTGGGGSIGSELCRQIASHNPKQLIIFDIYENNAYSIEQELLRKDKNLNLLTLIGSVRDSKKVESVFEKYKPQIVFHAAAHKHVPLMETSPNEAVKNNVSGTFKVADAAGRNNVERFILISTDKAVNPTNIMGATKRICEMIIQTMDKKYETDYVAVRFGNVLGSNGSVIPLFTKQIQEGGPVTVTHKDIVRYFMTIPEAVSLVLQAGAYANGGEIFVLDMGEPVRIYDLAENMIKLMGLVPNKDIEIKITGLRPGEKLYEERLMEEEGLQKTPNQMISIGKPLVIDEENLFQKIQELYIEAYNETDKMKDLVHELVPTYKIDKTH